MSKQKEKKFIGNTRVHKFENGGKIIKIGIKIEDLQAHVSDTGWVNIVVTKKRDADGTGEKDYYCYVDDYQPKQT